MPTKTQLYHAIVDKYIETYGTLPDNGNNPLLFNITGGLRNYLYMTGHKYDSAIIKYSLFATCVSVIFTPDLITIVLVLAIVFVIVRSFVTHVDYADVFDGEFIEIYGRVIGVVAPTQVMEGQLESKNFEEINDKRKLGEALVRADLDGSANMSVWSVGSTTTQCIDGQGHVSTTEIEVGVDASNDDEITKLLNAQKLASYDVMVVMNSAGYAIRMDAGIVYNENQSEDDTITPNIAPRVVGGSGDNGNAMNFMRKLVAQHKAGGYKFILAIVPRGDPIMPQGGSHTNQRILEAARHGINITVIEVSGKQTKVFELMDGGARDYSAESICGRIKNKKIVTSEGKTHGSGVVFKGIDI